MGIFVLSSSFPPLRNRGGVAHAGGGLGRRLGARGRLRSEGKERGRREDPIPGRGLGRGGLRRPGHESGQR